MILRLSQKLNAIIKAGPLSAVPLDKNPFADWSAHLFVADRTQYVILSNTTSLYSTVMFGEGTVRFAKALNRSVTTSMNDLVRHAIACLAGGELSPQDVGFELNNVLLSSIARSDADRYGKPREAFKNLANCI